MAKRTMHAASALALGNPTFVHPNYQHKYQLGNEVLTDTRPGTAIIFGVMIRGDSFPIVYHVADTETKEIHVVREDGIIGVVIQETPQPQREAIPGL